MRRSCYEVLTTSFGEDERTADTLVRHGLLDQDPGIRHQSAFYLGDFKVQRAEQALPRRVGKGDGEGRGVPPVHRGEVAGSTRKADVLPVLIAAVSDDAFMSAMSETSD